MRSNFPSGIVCAFITTRSFDAEGVVNTHRQSLTSACDTFSGQTGTRWTNWTARPIGSTGRTCRTRRPFSNRGHSASSKLPSRHCGPALFVTTPLALCSRWKYRRNLRLFSTLIGCFKLIFFKVHYSRPCHRIAVDTVLSS